MTPVSNAQSTVGKIRLCECLIMGTEERFMF